MDDNVKELIADRINTHWWKLAKNLNLSAHIRNAINGDEPNNQCKGRAVLQKWEESNYDPNWDTLKAALFAIPRKDIIGAIERR